MSVKTFEELEIWQLGRKLVKEVYTIDLKRDYSFANQIRRAAVSIMSNIAEGFERDGNQEFIQFLSIAKGSCGEVRSQLYIAYDLGYISETLLRELLQLARIVSMKTMKLIIHLRGSGMRGTKFKADNKEKAYLAQLQNIYNEVVK